MGENSQPVSTHHLGQIHSSIRVCPLHGRDPAEDGDSLLLPAPLSVARSDASGLQGGARPIGWNLGCVVRDSQSPMHAARLLVGQDHTEWAMHQHPGFLSCSSPDQSDSRRTGDSTADPHDMGVDNGTAQKSGIDLHLCSGKLVSLSYSAYPTEET